MNKKTTPTAQQQYAAAYTAHYSTKDLRLALQLYGEIITADPDGREAEWSRAQIQNVVKEVVPRSELLADEVKLALARLARADQSIPGSTP